MKKLFVTLAAVLALGACANQKSEQKDSNGGSGVDLEFIEAAQNLINRLKLKPVAGVSVTALEAVVAETRITTKPNLVLRGRDVDAINYPTQKLIEVSTARWNNLSSTPWLRLQLVFHEYLGIMRVDDHDYKVSRQIFNSDLCQRTPAVVAAVEKALRRSCDEVTLKDLSFVTELTLVDLKTFNVSDFRDMPKLGMLEINSSISKLVLTPEFMSLLPNLYNLDVKAQEVVISAGTFASTTKQMTHLAIYNAQLEKGSVAGLNAYIVMIHEISHPSKLEGLTTELATANYGCARNVESSGNLVLSCMKN